MKTFELIEYRVACNFLEHYSRIPVCKHACAGANARASIYLVTVAARSNREDAGRCALESRNASTISYQTTRITRSTDGKIFYTGTRLEK